MKKKYKKMLKVLKKSKAGNYFIYIREKVTHDLDVYVAAALEWLRSQGSPDFSVIIDSTGGDCRFGFSIYDQFMAYDGKITCTATGLVESMASIIMQACDVRLMTTHAVMLIHNPSRNTVSLLTLIKSDKSKALIKDLSATQERFVKVYKTRTGLTKKELLAQFEKEETMSARKSLKFCLIDKIVSKKFKK